MKVIGMIPARLQSRRLSEKALVDILGMPMIVHTCKRAAMAKKIDEVYLVTDSDKIREIAEAHGIKVIMTSPNHTCGSDRIAEAIQNISCDIVVNIQGDEPLLYPDHVDAIVQSLEGDPEIKCALGVTDYAKRNSPSDIKAVLDLQGNVLYCSRSDLPSDVYTPVIQLAKLCFLVAFRKSFLLKYAAWSPTPLERIEYNEYLRILEHGEKIRAVKIEGAKISVDTAEDLEVVRRLMVEDELRLQYM
jgi:3-deoxy-manno-octulosonate cytidylyltransferase (CMP-KDO synthetase)